MLPLGIGQRLLLVENPLIGGFFATSRTKAALTAEANFLLMIAIGIGALMGGIAHDIKPAGEHFDDIFNNRLAQRFGMRAEKCPPTGLE